MVKAGRTINPIATYPFIFKILVGGCRRRKAGWIASTGCKDWPKSNILLLLSAVKDWHPQNLRTEIFNLEETSFYFKKEYSDFVYKQSPFYC